MKKDATRAGIEETPYENPLSADRSVAADPVVEGTDDLQARMAALLADITNKEGLKDAMSQLPYTVDAVRTLRESLPEDQNQRARIISLAAEILVDEWNGDKDKAGMMATLLSQTWKDWHPEAQTIQQLVELCEATIDDGDSSMVAIVQPTAFVLGALGNHEFYGKWLSTTTTEATWRQADLERNIGSYYGSREKQLTAIERHLADPNRAGILIMAHDVGLLVQICEEHRAEGLSDDPEVQRTKKLLAQVISVLEKHRQTETAVFTQTYLS
ncbi:MAG: hypothetical protein PHZ00_02700 [Candidatus Peribacteraceae bacterium]|nr:hypothetical protein [Candidatus Peribacteraceae bacterium]